MIINEGKQVILEYYLNNKDLYLGLWSYSDNPIYKNTVKLDNIKYFELSNLGYSRQKISKGNWILDSPGARIFKSTIPAEFKALETWNTIYGYFLTTTEDNSGKLLSIIVLNGPLSLLKFETVNIYPFIESK